jgi:hypothetical protein
MGRVLPGGLLADMTVAASRPVGLFIGETEESCGRGWWILEVRSVPINDLFSTADQCEDQSQE